MDRLAAQAHTRAGQSTRIPPSGSPPNRNTQIASVIEMIGEALALAEKHGVGGSSVLEFIEAFFPAPPIVVSLRAPPRSGAPTRPGRRSCGLRVHAPVFCVCDVPAREPANHSVHIGPRLATL